MASLINLIFIWVWCKTVINIESKYMRSFDDSVIFQMNWPGPKRRNQELQSSSKYQNHEALQESNSLFLTSVDNEKYHCLLPTASSSEKPLQNEEYIGPLPLQLLKPLFAKITCSYRLEQYWTYELCHGRFLRQYHDESTVQGKSSQEYFLGKFDGYHLKSAEEEFTRKWERWKQSEEKTLPTMKVEGIDLPALELNMTEGTVCDINNKHRITHVYYVCHEDGKHEIYSLKESSSCEYEVIILSPLLCAHPDFRVKSAPENDIYCHAVGGSPRKPERLSAIEQDAELFQHGDIEKYILNTEQEQPPTKSPVVEDPHDSKLVQDFLNGDYCLQGGTGWWKHEFCYGKKVEQFHEQDKNGARSSILLGSWNIQRHLLWLEQNPQKRPRKDQALRQVSHLYTSGSFCDEIGKPRQVEVKLKCKEVKGHPNAVSLYLLEPKTCEYILGVESPIICSLLETADEDGLFRADFKT